MVRIAPKHWSRRLTAIPTVFVMLAILPMQAQAQMQRRPGRSGNKNSGSPPPTDVLATAVAKFTGKLRALDKKEIVIVSEDDQIVSFHRSKKTRFLADEKEIKPQDIPLESQVIVEASKDSVGDLIAVDIIWKKS
jgi:hypothetical protein